MPPDRDESTRQDIVRACVSIAAFTAGMEGDTFSTDHKTQSAVLYQLAIIGEAVARLSDPFKAEYAQVPWRSIRGMRNLIVHDYEGVNVGAIWVAIERDVPELRDALETSPSSER